MQVTSMFGAGYLEPVSKISAADKARRASLYQVNKNDQAQGVNNNTDAASLKRQEQDILTQEQNLRSRLGTGAEVHTVYHYTLGADGKRYITGASVTMKGSEEDLERAGGGLSTKDIQVKQDEDLTKVHGSNDERSSSNKSNNSSSSSGSNLAGDKDLSESEEKLVQELKDAEREVIAHEAAHQAAAGALGGGVSYTYTKGPDGKSYITGGEVPIQMRTGSTPEETLRNMQQVQRAASAPADPSGQDRKVAAKAAAMAAEARQQISRENLNDNKDGRSTEIARGTPILNNTANNSDDKNSPVKNGVASIMASIRELQVQALVPAA